jgi:cytochrome c556
MSYKVKQIALTLILAASLVGSTALHAESIIPALHATMRTMRASLAQIGDFAKGDGEPAATWNDVDRFLDAQKHLVIETSKLLATVKDGNTESIGQQLTNTRKACSACHDQFREE